MRRADGREEAAHQDEEPHRHHRDEGLPLAVGGEDREAVQLDRAGRAERLRDREVLFELERAGELPQKKYREALLAHATDARESRELLRIRTDAPVRPDGPYGVGKAFGEAVGRYYADAWGLSVICLRIGTVNRADRPTGIRHFATLLTHRDLVSLVRCCIDAPPDVRFGIAYGVSRNTWRLWDVEAARELIGFEPSDNAESFRASFRPDAF